MILQEITKTKTASVWGLGYLGYTTMLKLQDCGFNILVYNFDKNVNDLFLNGGYPSKEQAVSWTAKGYLPKLDMSRIKFVDSPAKLFVNKLHFVAIPENSRKVAEESIAAKVAGYFSKFLRKGIAPLVVFESAFIPGHIERNFIKTLLKKGKRCSSDYYIGAWFRTDWRYEDFLSQADKMPISGHCKRSKLAMKELFDYLGISSIELNSIKDSEIYVNSINAVAAMVNDFVRQLSAAYKGVDLKTLSKHLFKNLTFKDCALNIGTGGTQFTFAIDYLIRGSDDPEKLTLLKEFQDINISSVLSYAEFILQKSFKSVAILGVTYKGNQKDLILSPSVTLAAYLIKNSIKVMLHDPYCGKEEIQALVPGSKVISFPDGAFKADVLILACDHNEYKYVSQESLKKMLRGTKLIIDNYGIWSHLNLSKKTNYYEVGVGSLSFKG